VTLGEALPVWARIAAPSFGGPAGQIVKAEGRATNAEESAGGVGSVDIRDRAIRSLEAACLAEQGAASGWCSAYLMGVAGTLSAFGQGGDKAGICISDYRIEQLPEAFLTWARADEALRKTDMLAGASLAFRQKRPCR